MGQRAEEIKNILMKSLNPLEIQVVDESELHLGHAGARPEGETHYSVSLVCESFRGRSRIERHRMINTLLAPFFEKGLHALKIKAFAPGETP